MLTVRQYLILNFERYWWKYAGAKEAAIWDLFGVSATRYYQKPNVLIDHPAALEHDPLLVHRLERLRRQRTAVRAPAMEVALNLPEEDQRRGLSRSSLRIWQQTAVASSVAAAHSWCNRDVHSASESSGPLDRSASPRSETRKPSGTRPAPCAGRNHGGVRALRSKVIVRVAASCAAAARYCGRWGSANQCPVPG